MSVCTNQKGFSMLEVLVALSILIVGTFAVATMLMRSSENAIFSTQSRGSDTTALELVEAVKGEAANTTFAELSSLRLEKLIPGSTSQYEYRDDATATTGNLGVTLPDHPYMSQYVERLGTGLGYVYKWRVEELQLDQQTPPYPKLPTGMLKLEVTVGWKNCTGNNPDTCRRRSKITNWVVESKN